ncbi:MAG: deoxyhypusine synthase [Candidatus Bathyarchaeota archaeon]|nr:MAG: deoxyhypusine synthase [Candidatus Bathyarchaeota archaeon]
MPESFYYLFFFSHLNWRIRNLKYIKHIEVTSGMTAGQLVAEMGKSGVLGAGRLARAAAILKEMFTDPDYTVFLTLAGPMIPGGLRSVVGELISRKYIDVIVASGANIVHDVIEGLGFKEIRGSFSVDDIELKKQGIGRAGDIFFQQKGFEALEKQMSNVFHSILKRGVDNISISDLISEISKKITDLESVLKKASIHGVPIFSPGLLDSMIGLHLWTFNQIKQLRINPILDLNRLSDIIYDAKKIGAIFLGGGLPKHHVLGVSILKDGVNAAVQITLDRPEGGSLSGAPLEEAISWNKAKPLKKLETVIGDATIIFPLLVAAVLED